MSASLVGSEMCIRDSHFHWRQTRPRRVSRAVAARFLEHAVVSGGEHMLHARSTCPALWDRATLLAYGGDGSLEIEFARDSVCEEC
eukprot:10962682-Alexandrium_andersonii.AAC.1